jgi:hypothetical protein
MLAMKPSLYMLALVGSLVLCAGCSNRLQYLMNDPDNYYALEELDQQVRELKQSWTAMRAKPGELDPAADFAEQMYLAISHRNIFQRKHLLAEDLPLKKLLKDAHKGLDLAAEAQETAGGKAYYYKGLLFQVYPEAIAGISITTTPSDSPEEKEEQRLLEQESYNKARDAFTLSFSLNPMGDALEELVTIENVLKRDYGQALEVTKPTPDQCKGMLGNVKESGEYQWVVNSCCQDVILNSDNSIHEILGCDGLFTGKDLEGLEAGIKEYLAAENENAD